MIRIFNISLPGKESCRYNVYHFYPSIYFVKSVFAKDEVAGFVKGISIWKSNGKWISASDYNEVLVSQLGDEIDKHNDLFTPLSFGGPELSIN